LLFAKRTQRDVDVASCQRNPGRLRGMGFVASDVAGALTMAHKPQTSRPVKRQRHLLIRSGNAKGSEPLLGRPGHHEARCDMELGFGGKAQSPQLPFQLAKLVFRCELGIAPHSCRWLHGSDRRRRSRWRRDLRWRWQMRFWGRRKSRARRGNGFT
jgi:hypothetical protein